MQNLMLPTRANLFGNYKLKPIKMLGTAAKITDYATINGGFSWPSEISSSSYGTYVFEDRKNKDGDIVSYIEDDGKADILLYNSGLGIRPVADFSSLKDSSKFKYKKREDGIVEIEYGYCLQDAVSKKMQDELNNITAINSLVISSEQKEKIKNILQVDDMLQTPDKYFNNIKIYDDISYDETPVYNYKNRRFANVTVQNHNVIRNSFRLSNGESYQNGEKVWIEEKPVKWLLDEEQGLMISEMILQAGIKFYHDDYPTLPNFYSEGLKLYLNQFMIKDSLNDAKELIKRK